jgi:ABC-2 type transport system permease protein
MSASLDSRISSRLLEFLGIDAAQFRALLRISLWIDFRGSAQAALGGASTENPLKASLFIYGLLSLFFVPLAFVVPANVYARAVMIFGMFFLLMIMLIEYGATLVVADDMRTVGWRPISSRTYLAARLTNTLVLISVFDIVLFFAPGIAGVFAKRSSHWFPVVFIPCALLAGIFVAGVVAACYTTLLRIFRPERFRGILNAFQVGFMFLLILFTQTGPYVREHKAEHHPVISVDSAAWSWADLSPANWFAAPTEVVVNGPSHRALALSAVAVVATLGLFAVLLGTLSLDYLERLAAASEATGSGPSSNRGVALWRRLAGLALLTAEERVMFDFVRQIYLRDRKIRLRAYPSLAYAVVPGLILLFRGLKDPHLALLAPAAVAGFLPIPLLTQIPYWGESHGEWVFALAGFESISDLALGIKKSIFFTFQLPALIGFSIALLFLAGPVTAGAAALLALGIAIFILELTFLLVSPGLPFSRELAAAVSATNAIVGFGSLIALGIIGLIVYFIANTPLRVIAVGLVLLLAGVALDPASSAKFSIEERETFRGSGGDLFQ